jgi:hypothetical protein
MLHTAPLTLPLTIMEADFEVAARYISFSSLPRPPWCGTGPAYTVGRVGAAQPPLGRKAAPKYPVKKVDGVFTPASGGWKAEERVFSSPGHSAVASSIGGLGCAQARGYSPRWPYLTARRLARAVGPVNGE